MKVYLSPQVGGQTVHYAFNDPMIKATINGDDIYIDLSSIEPDHYYDVAFPLLDVKRVDDELHVVLFQGVDEYYTESSEWVTPEESVFEVSGEVIQPSVITPSAGGGELSLDEQIERLAKAVEEMIVMTLEGGEV